MTELRRITRDDVRPLAALQVRPEQSRFVAPNALTMAEAAFEPGAEVYGIRQDAAPVGLIAVIDLVHPEQELEPGEARDELEVWRLMIAADHQGQGHGAAALRFAIDLAQGRGRRSVRLSSVDAPGCAIPFYERLGFCRTGGMLGDEVVMALALP